MPTGREVVATFPVRPGDDVMLVTDAGQLIRCPVDGIRIAGRSTQGVIVFDTAEGEQGGIVLSRAKAEQFKVWRDIEEAFEQNGTVEGTIVGKVKGGLKVDVGVAAFLPGSHADLRPARNLDRYIGQRGRFAILKFNRARGNEGEQRALCTRGESQ